MTTLSLSSTAKLNSGYEIPRLGLGVALSRGSICVDACLAAFKCGYKHVDSATMYGNELEVGQAIRESGLNGEDVFITSKVRTEKGGYEAASKAVDESLKNLQLSYLDLYLVHDPVGGKENRIGAYRALVEAQKAGKVRSVGVSNYNIHHLQEIKAEGLPTPSVDQIEIHPYCQQRPIVEYCVKNGIAVEAYAPLIRGRIAEDDAIRRIASSKGVSPFQLLVRWSLQKGFVPLPKSEKPERVAMNADVFGFELTKDEMDELDALDRGAEGAVSWNPVNKP